ncbi:hypothetical protein SAMN05216371_8299 [Streptomyces sp. TLI_053]|nr:hypothetical protein SAMN05216371_8299 [Streptomyces sp. TLI_053]
MPGAEPHPNRAAQVSIAALARIPHPHLARAPRQWEPVASTRPARPGRPHPPTSPGNAPRAIGNPLSPPTPSASRTTPAAPPRRLVPPRGGHRRLRTRHHTWPAGDEHSPVLDVAALPELHHAQRAHQRVIRRPGADLAWSWAQTITTRFSHTRPRPPAGSGSVGPVPPCSMIRLRSL